MFSNVLYSLIALFCYEAFDLVSMYRTCCSFCFFFTIQ